MLNKEYTFPTKVSGPANCQAPDAEYYGTLRWTWNFDIHFPVITVDYANSVTGKNLASGAGSTALAEANLLKIATLARTYIHSKLAVIARNHLEYRIAHDTDLIQDMLQFQLEILQTWGGYESLYRVTDADNQKSIGMAAEDFIKGVDIWSRYYTWRLETEDIRNGY
jgi:hypothetical protein